MPMVNLLRLPHIVINSINLYDLTKKMATYTLNYSLIDIILENVGLLYDNGINNEATP